MSEEQKTETRTTSADIKKQIEQAKAEIKNSGMPLAGQMANEINASASTPAQSREVESKPDPVQPAAKSVEGAKPTSESVDLKEWAKKKGYDWTTEEAVLSVLRKADQAFHAKRLADKAREIPAPPAYSAPAYQAPAPQYAPPPLPNPVAIANIAREYNMTPEDAERLLKFNRDFFDAASRANNEQMQRKLREIELDNQKNTVFRELSSDPVFRKAEVGAEFTNVVEQMQLSDPHAFEQDPTMYMRAYEKALQNIGRRNLEGRPLTEGVPPSARQVFPTTPPRALGNGSGGGATENQSEFDPEAFAKLKTSAEKAEFLGKMGLRPAY